MALVQFGGGVMDIRGSIGGQVFSKNRFGNYIRARITPVDPKSAGQTFMRTVMAGNAIKWHDALTQANRDAWEVYANSIVTTNKLGAAIKLTGFRMIYSTR